MSKAHEGLLPGPFQQTIDALMEAAGALRKQLELTGKGEPLDRTSPRGARSHAATSLPSETTEPAGNCATQPTPGLSGEEIQSIAAVSGGACATSQYAAKRRYPYDCVQTIFVWRNDESGGIASGQTVRCNDIAPEGMSFFWLDAPVFERFIISLGSATRRVYIAAEITHSKAVYMHGELCYLVSCRFLGRVPQFNEQNRVQFNVRRERNIYADQGPAIPTSLA
jgi:hypothetical protein